MSKNEGVAENHSPSFPVLLTASLKGLSATCGDNRGEGEESGVKLGLGSGDKRCFPEVF